MIAGNPTIWIVASGLWAPSLGWPGPLMLLQPSVAPLALLGIGRRSWWVSAVMLAVASLLFGSLWADWFRSVANLRASGPSEIFFSLLHLPVLLAPVIVAASSRERRLAVGNGPTWTPSAT